MSYFCFDDTNAFREDHIEKRGRNRHTIRRYPFRRRHIVSISRKGNRIVQNENGNNEIPITEIDQYFDMSFVYNKHFYSDVQRPLNSRDRWEDVEEKLESLAVKRSTEYHRYYNTVTTHYEVPITGHIIFTKDNSRDVNEISKKNYGAISSSGVGSNWLFWNGKFHDPSYIYEYIPGHNPSVSAGTLKQLCPLENHRGRGGDGQVNDAFANNLLQKFGSELARDCMIDHENKGLDSHYHLNQQDGDKKQFIEIDLRSVCEVKAIVTRGGYPKQLETFPTTKKSSTNKCCARIIHINGRRGRNGPRRRKRRQPFVYVARDRKSLAWVELYSIHYRDMISGKWLPYGNSFYTGNHDVHTFKLNEVNIRTRYIRLTPVKFHQFREMRVSIWGNQVSNFLGNRTPCNLLLGDSTKTETIRYTIHPPEISTRFDGYTKSYRDCYGAESKHKKKSRFTSHVREQLALISCE